MTLEPSWMGLVPLGKRPQRASLTPPLCKWTVRRCCLWTRKQALSSVQFNRSVVSDSVNPRIIAPRPPCPWPTPGVYWNSFSLSWWCHPTFLSSIVPFSSCLQTFPESVFSNESVLRIRWPNYWSFSFSISLSMNSQDWFPLEWTHWISLQSKGLWRVFSNTTVQKQQLFGTQPVLYSNSHIHTWLLEKP